jgi:hypothetical protein
MPAAAPPAAAPPEAAGLFPQRGDRCVSLGGLGLTGPDGSREIRVGRSKPRTGHAPDVDLSDEPFGWRVQRRQAILRYGAAGWTVEEWIDADNPREGHALSTRVNGVALSPGERRPLTLGDALAFGPVRMRLDRLAADVPSASGPVGNHGRTPPQEEPAAAPPSAAPLRPPVRPESTAPRATLRAASGTIFPIDRAQVVLGRRHPSSTPHPDVNLAGEPGGETVSRQHARIYFREGRWWIVQHRDVVNWTGVQGHLLRTGESVQLQDGDRLDIGEVTLTFRTGTGRPDDRS